MATDSTRRVVITGMGLVSPLAATVKQSWQRLISGQSGISLLPAEIRGDTPIQIGGLVPAWQPQAPYGLAIDQFIANKDRKKSDRFIQLALIAAQEAIEQAQLAQLTVDEKNQIATIIATGIGGFHAISQAVNTVNDKGSKRLSPFTIPSFIANLAAAHISIKYGFKGPLATPVTACAASIQSIGDGFKAIVHDEMEVAVVGGSESCINSVSLGGFHAAKALSTGYNDGPELASRPFDSQRDGFVMSEGAAILVLEELQHAIKRGVNILAEVVGYATTADAYHITAGPANGEGAARCMALALKQAQLPPSAIDYINAHSTSTPLGDLAELAAIEQVFQNHPVAISSTKSATGHLLGAAGSTGAIFAVKAIQQQIAPASLNISQLEPIARGLNIVQNQPRAQTIKTTMVNGFGFGGVNASVILRAFA